MNIRRADRARGRSYQGPHRYFITCCTFGRSPFFQNELVVADAYLRLRRTLDAERFALLAYVFMPDHLHLLLEGQTDASDLPKCVNGFKQASGCAFAKRHGRHLWQTGYYDHVLRDEETTAKVARYIFESPVRTGLVASPHDYPYLGSDLGALEGFF